MSRSSGPELLIGGIGLLASGDAGTPRLDASRILIRDGRVAAIGEAVAADKNARVVDARGGVVLPGLWDAYHVLAFGDHEPVLDAHGYLARTAATGTTTVVSAGTLALPGRPRDARGATSLAILAARSWAHERPGGITTHAGALIAVPGLADPQLRAAADAGVRRLSIVEPFADRDEATRCVALARDNGFSVMADCGHGSLIVGASVREALALVRPDVSACVNGPVALADGDIAWLLDQASGCLGLTPTGSLAVATRVATAAAARGALGRLVISTRTPHAGMILPDGVGRFVAFLAAIPVVGPEAAIAIGSGNAARAYGAPGGRIAVGEPADLIVLEGPTALAALVDGAWRAPEMVLVGGDVLS
ncbi:MAG TPA: hypothetical protein VHG53_01920 [Candidatus Limnocylindria bacterium]|nr:hypothetical protein [Candidatus Limnocylindria bacterium]